MICLLHLHLPDRPNLAELGRFACRWLLERIGFLQGGETFPAHSAVGLQGQGDRWPVKGCDAKKVSPAVLSGFMCGFQGHYGFGFKVKFHLKYLHVPVCHGTDAQSKCGDVSFQPMQAPRCTMVTSSRRLPEKVRAWLRNSNAEHCLITNRTMKRLGVGRTFWEIAGN